MTDKLVAKIYEDVKNFRDPVKNIRLGQNDNNINIVCKNGNVSEKTFSRIP